MKKRILSALLTLGMVLTMLPVSVFATENDGAPTGKTVYVDENETPSDIYYTDLDTALAAVSDGDTIKLAHDVTTEGFNLSNSVTIEAAEDLTEKPTITFENTGIALWGKALTFKNVDVVMNGIGSTPYTAEWGWMTICASKDASLTLDNVNMTMDATGATNSPHAIYFCNNNVLNILNGSNLTIRNYPQDALEWDGGNGGYNVNITDSTFVSDHNRSGFTGTFYATITNSNVDVINSTGNGSNGSHFVIDNSQVKFEKNGSHGLSAGNLTIRNHSTVIANDNGMYGITYTGTMTMDGTSKVEVYRNALVKSGGGLRAANATTNSKVEAGAIMEICDNGHNGLENYGTFTFENGVDLTITGNDERTTNGGGIFNGSAGNLTLPVDAVIMKNHAGQTGGGICNAGTVTIPSSVQLYNNHAETAGDDIYNRDGATINFAEVGSGWELDDCGHTIDGWYDDSEGSRWEADTEPYHAVEFTAFEALNGMTTVTGLTALKAAHGVEPIDPGEVPEDTWETSKSKTATNLDADYQSQVTLSLPAESYKPSVDVVMVIDVSSSMKETDIAEAKAAANAMCNELAGKDNIETKIGIVTFDKEAHNLTNGLVSIDEARTAINSISASEDTNMVAGLMMAKEILSSGNGTDQYLVLMSDGIPTYWVENGQITSKTLIRYAQDKITELSRSPAGTEPEGSAPDTEVMSMEQILSATDWDSDSNEWKQISDTGEDINPDCKYTNIQKAAYKTAEYLQEEILGQYSVKMVAFGTDKYENNAVYQYGENLCDWIGAQSGVSYFKISKPGYGGEAGELTEAFQDIANEMVYLVDKGTKVVDKIGSGTYSGTEYDFDFINSLDALTLTVGGEKLDGEELIDPSYTDPYVTSAYGFGPNVNGTYQFVLNYYEKGEDGQSDECFVWEINVPVEVGKKVQLTYTVQLTNPKTESGTYGTYDADGSEGYDGLYTNNEATLYPVDSNGVPGQAENFYRPTVSYTVGTVSITPADITIYTGGDGYDSVITDVNGDQVETSAGTGLPTPGFYIELPHEVDQALKEAVGAPLDQPLDLSKYLTFTYDDGQGNTRTWHLERYDNKEGNDSMAYNRYIYRILPAEVNGEQIPVRLQFTDDDGTFMTSDDFTVSLDELYHEYDMTIYAGDLNQKLVKAVLTVNNAATEYDATVESGELTVRGVTDNDTHYTTVEDSVPENVTSVTAQVGENAKFYINGSQLEVIDPSDVKLLVDSLVPDQNNTLVNSALVKFDAIPNDYDYEARYLDLVDTSNGNAYVTTDDAVVVYWAYPEGTDENTEFHLVHYVGLDRNDNNDLTSGTYTMEYYSEEIGNLKTTEQGIRFTVNSFSPFTLFWEDDSNNGGGSSGGGGGSKPELNKEDHIAYVSGYPDGTVQPEGYITREEVATIFFRLLTDESRADFITDYNPYPDVASDRWSYYAITTMTNGNLMLGRTGGVFDPGANITRAEFAVVAAQFSNAQYSGPDKFTDISDHWARDYINRAANEGWIAGYPDGTFGPDRFITRAEVMALVNEVLERAPDADYMLDNMTVWPDNPKSAWYYEDVQEATNSHSYVWRNTQHTSEDWEDFISMRTFNELVRDAFNAAN